MKHISSFPRKPRTMGAAMYCEDGIDPTDHAILQTLELRMRRVDPTFVPGSITSIEQPAPEKDLHFTCYLCARAKDRATRVARYSKMVAKPCAKCAMPLHEAMPTEPYVGPEWIRNTSHRHPRGRACLRCLRGRAPPWSTALRTVCRNWRHLDRDNILYIVIFNLGMCTRYKVPWKGGLDKIALFGRFPVSPKPSSLEGSWI